MWGYWSGTALSPMDASEDKSFARIQPAGPWKYTNHNHDGKRGVLAFLGEESALEPHRTCKDGLVYFGPAKPPSQEDLARLRSMPCFTVTTSSGRILDIPLAVYSPRILAFDGEVDGGEFATEFGREALRIWNAIEAKNYPKNGEIARLVFLAVQQCYAVTEELLSDLGWLTDADIVPILLAVGGRDPKFAAAAGATCPLSVAAS